MLKKEEKKILKEFISKKFPEVFYKDGNQEIVFLDAAIAGYVTNVLHYRKIKKIHKCWIFEEENDIIKKNIEDPEVKEFFELLMRVLEILDKHVKKL